MLPCIFCGEEISPDARICRHCNRTAVYGLVLIRKLDDKREKHAFIRKWQSLEKIRGKHLALASYTQSKDELDKAPLILAWDITRTEANQLLSQLSDFESALEVKISTSLNASSSYESFVAKNTPKSDRWFGYAYAAIAIFFLGVAIALFTRSSTFNFLLKNQSSTELPQSLGKLESHSMQLDLPGLEVPRVSKTPAPPLSKDTAVNPAEHLTRGQMSDLLNATVFIRDEKSLGSGFVISSDGYILTNSHVVSPMDRPLVILRDGRQLEATKIKDDPRLDVALLKIGVYDLKPLKLGDANQLYPGQSVLTIGNPGGLSFTVTRGIVSFLGRNVRGIPFIQTDAAINRGNSGGPMINDQMEVVGINSLTSLNEQGISFALPINFVCQRGGMIDHIGFSCDPFQPDNDPTLSQTAYTPDPQKRNSLLEIYQQEADRYKEEMNAKVSALSNEFDALKAKFESLKAEYDKTKKAALYNELKNLEARSKQIAKEETSAKILFIDEMISLYQRQKGDAEFANAGEIIDRQIAELEASKSKLLSYSSND